MSSGNIENVKIEDNENTATKDIVAFQCNEDEAVECNENKDIFDLGYTEFDDIETLGWNEYEKLKYLGSFKDEEEDSDFVYMKYTKHTEKHEQKHTEKHELKHTKNTNKNTPKNTNKNTKKTVFQIPKQKIETEPIF